MARKRLYLIGFVLLFSFIALSISSGARDVEAQDKPKTSQFSALAYLPTGAGMRGVGAGSTANVNIYVKSYTSDEEAKQFALLLVEKGPDELLKALEKAPSIGKVQLVRKVGFFDLKLIRSRPTETGRRIVGVSDRPIGFLELYHGGRSLDNKFGILILDLKTNKKGKEEGVGTLIYAAQVKVLEGNKIEVENYGIEPVRLMGVRKF